MKLKVAKKATMASPKKDSNKKEKLKNKLEKRLIKKEEKRIQKLAKKKKEKKARKILEKIKLQDDDDDEEEKTQISDDDSEASEPESSGRAASGDEVHVNVGGVSSNGSIEGGDGDDDDVYVSDDGDSDSYQSVEESDSSEDEVPSRNTIGEVPLEFYKEEEHIGYDITGRKIKKKERKDQLEKFLASADDSKSWRKFVDEYNDEEVELTKDEIKKIRRIIKGKTPHAEVDPYAPYVDWFEWEGKGHPLSNAPEPKSRFIRSKSEAKQISKLVRGIREGRIKFDKPKEEPRFYLLWGDDSSSSEKTRGLSYIPPPKAKLPGHEESYNPSLEYIPTQEEINAFQLMYEEDRPQFIPIRYTSLRSIPAYENFIKEVFSRHLDLYLCPRVRKKRLNVDPESIKPKRPDVKDFKPYPTTCYIEYKGHTDAVISISTESSGQWIASGSKDGTVRIWEVATGRCIRVWEVGSGIRQVAWNPLPNQPILAVSVDHDVLILDTGLGSEEEQRNIRDLLHFEKPTISDESGDAAIVSWHSNEKLGGLRLKHFKSVTSIEWHRRGDYLSSVMPAGESRAIMIHQLSKKGSQKIPFKLHGLPVSTAFHPYRSVFFISTKQNVRVYDLLKEKLIKRLETRLREVSSIAVHPGGDNLIVGSKEGKLCWFDMDLASTPYQTLSNHTKDITNVTFHRSYPLFATCSEDGLAYVFHGMVYSDLNQNPFILPLRILKGSSKGILDCKFHPRQPWLFTACVDSVIRLYCH